MERFVNYLNLGLSILLLFSITSFSSNSKAIDLLNTKSIVLNSFAAHDINSIKNRVMKTDSITNGSIRSPHLYQNIPVLGSELIYHFRNHQLVHVSGRRAQISSISIKPKLNKAQATQKIKTYFPDFQGQSIQLTIIPLKKETLLAYEITSKISSAGKIKAYLNAHTGELIEAYDSLHYGFGHGSDDEMKNLLTSKDNEGSGKFALRHMDKFPKFETRSKIHGRLGPLDKLTGLRVLSDDDYFDDSAAVDAHYFTEKYMKLLKSDFNRNSYDNEGTPIKSYVHVSMSFFSRKYVNAFWDGVAMSYGDGDGKNSSPLSGALDVVAHEITHGITSHSSKLIYKGESGALNESFSDIMAAYAEYKIQPKKFDWKLGEDVWTPNKEGDALRYMDSPTKDKEAKLERQKESGVTINKELYSRDFYPEKFKGTEDNGGVHLNSGIPNLIFYLLSEGGQHPRLKTKVNVEKIGIEKAVKIFYQAFTTHLMSDSKFIDAKKATIFTAADIYDEKTAKIVESAWNAVGVN